MANLTNWMTLLGVGASILVPAGCGAPGVHSTTAPIEPIAPDQLVCTTWYADEINTHVVPTTDQPYSVASLDVGPRFRLRVVRVVEPQLVPSLNIYVYSNEPPPARDATFTSREPKSDFPTLVHQVKYAAPEETAGDARYGFTGLQHIYDVNGREFRYWCGFRSAHPDEAASIADKSAPSLGSATATTPAPPPPSDSTVRLVFAGDILLGEGPGRMLERGEDPFAYVAPWLAASDLQIGNLECPVAVGGTALRKPFIFRADPSTLTTLRHHFDVVSLANNHSGDYGMNAFRETLDHVERSGLARIGGGADQTDAHKPYVVKHNGITIALLGYDDFHPRWFEATDRSPGVAWAEPEAVVRDIRAARADGAQVVIPFLHWGWENEFAPYSYQRELARLMIDAGASAVVGGHPHVTQGSETYAGAPIVYSLGNFVFDQLDIPENGRGWMLRLEVDGDGVARWDTVPVDIDAGGVPKPAPATAPCGTRERGAANCVPRLQHVAYGL